MLDPASVPSVDAQEMLSRFVLTRRYVNQQSKLLKSDAFVPHPHTELSVTRGRDATDLEIWNIAKNVAATRSKTLIGRGDALAATYIGQRLNVLAAPVEGNPNHANVTGWPHDDKPAQKLIAQEIAAVAKFVAYLEI
jgi:hypothetical protein